MTIYHIHHIIPKHMGGSDDPSNLVKVTIEEHANLHKQLWEDLGCWQDRIAWNVLSNLITHEEARRIAVSEASKEKWKNPTNKMLDVLRNKLIAGNIGRKHSKETCEKKSRSLKGRKFGASLNPVKGKDHPVSKKVMCEGKIFDCQSDAARYFGITVQGVSYRVNSKNFTEWTHYVKS